MSSSVKAAASNYYDQIRYATPARGSRAQLEALAELMRRFAGVDSPSHPGRDLLAARLSQPSHSDPRSGRLYCAHADRMRSEIVRCPPELLAEALALVLCDWRRASAARLAESLLDVEDAAELANEPLFIARRGGELLRRRLGTAAVGQLSPCSGRRSLPQVKTRQTAYALAGSVVRGAGRNGGRMTQALLPAPDADDCQRFASMSAFAILPICCI